MGGYETTFRIERIHFFKDSIRIYWEDYENHSMVTEFGEFTNDPRTMVQIRGRMEPDGSWNYYDRPFGRC